MNFKPQSRKELLLCSVFHIYSFEVLHNWERACQSLLLLPGPSYGLRFISGSVKCLPISVLSFLKHHRKINLEGSQWGLSEELWIMSTLSYPNGHEYGIKKEHSKLQITLFIRYGFVFWFCSLPPCPSGYILSTKWEYKAPVWSTPCPKDQSDLWYSCQPSIWPAIKGLQKQQSSE